MARDVGACLIGAMPVDLPPLVVATNYWMGLTLILTGSLLVAEVRHGFRGMGWLHGRFRGRRNRGASGWPFY